MHIRRSYFCLILAVLVFLLGVPSAHAQNTSSFYVTPWIGAGFYGGSVGFEGQVNGTQINKSELNDAPAFGLFVGGRIKNLMVEALFSTAFTTVFNEFTGPITAQVGYSVTNLTYGANIGYAFSTSKTSVVPYLSVGAGGVSYSPDDTGKSDFQAVTETSFMFNAGVGLEVPMTETVFFRFDLRDYISSLRGEFTAFPAFEVLEGEKSTVHNIVLAAGVTFRTK